MLFIELCFCLPTADIFMLVNIFAVVLQFFNGFWMNIWWWWWWWRTN